jgi:hypothetical protein
MLAPESDEEGQVVTNESQPVDSALQMIFAAKAKGEGGFKDFLFSAV